MHSLQLQTSEPTRAMFRRMTATLRRFSVCSDASALTAAPTLTHVDANGAASMVNVGDKRYTNRTATAVATVRVGSTVHALLACNISPGSKGDVFGVARLAGIMAAKRTPDLIPLCHSVPLANVAVDLRLDQDPALPNVYISATASTGKAQTGVEMEALTAATVAALTIYDMCKAASKDMIITDIQLVRKSGGESGDYVAERQ
jgi:cyclic pyranopterin monophosphate synthase